MKKILMLLVVLGIANLGMAQEVRRAGGRLPLSVVDSRCQFVESPWGGPKGNA